MADYTMPSMNQTVASEVTPPSATAANPLTMLNTVTETQGRLNAIKLFNQQMAARQRAGEIMASAPDMDSAMSNMSQDPQVMGFMPDILNTIRQADFTNTQIQQTRQTMGNTALHAVMQTVPLAMTDMGAFNKAIDMAMSAQPSSVQKMIAGSVQSLKSSLFDGLEDLPPEQRSLAYRQRWNAMQIAAGFSPDQIAGMTGTIASHNAGGMDIVGNQMPGVLGGQFTPTTGITKTPEPSVQVQPVGPEGKLAPVVIGGGTPGITQFNNLSGNPLFDSPKAGASAGAAASGNALGASPARPNTGAGQFANAPTLTGGKYLSDRGTAISGREEELDNRVQAGADQNKNVSEVIDDMKKTKTGGGSTTYARAAQIMQALGVNNEFVNKWINLPASQVMTKIDSQNAANWLKQALSNSKVTNIEFKTALSNNPNIDTDPNAVLEIANLWNQFYSKDKTEQRMLDAYKQGKPTGDKSLDKAAGGSTDIGRWPALWNQSDFMKGFAPGTAFSGKGVLGADQNGGLPPDIAAIMKKHLQGTSP